MSGYCVPLDPAVRHYKSPDGRLPLRPNAIAPASIVNRFRDLGHVDGFRAMGVVQDSRAESYDYNGRKGRGPSAIRLAGLPAHWR